MDVSRRNVKRKTWRYVTSYHSDNGNLDSYDLKRTKQYLDYIMFMGYDFNWTVKSLPLGPWKTDVGSSVYTNIFRLGTKSK